MLRITMESSGLSSEVLTGHKPCQHIVGSHFLLGAPDCFLDNASCSCLLRNRLFCLGPGTWGHTPIETAIYS